VRCLGGVGDRKGGRGGEGTTEGGAMAAVEENEVELVVAAAEENEEELVWVVEVEETEEEKVRVAEAAAVGLAADGDGG